MATSAPSLGKVDMLGLDIVQRDIKNGFKKLEAQQSQHRKNEQNNRTKFFYKFMKFKTNDYVVGSEFDSSRGWPQVQLPGDETARSKESDSGSKRPES